MKKYLVRGGANPLVQYRPADVLASNYIGGNSGNMLFLYGVLNILTTEEASCEVTKRKSVWSDEETERINEEFDAVILPMADAFRADYVPTLRNYTYFVSRLKIPCIICGAGLRAEYEPEIELPRSFDDTVRDFIKEVLKHSAKVGLRGEITGRYLERLGFSPNNDFTVIGCPSLYMHGTSIGRKEPDLHRTGVSLNAIADDSINAFYIDLIQSDKNIHIIQQRRTEFVDWYYGKATDLSTSVPEFRQYNIFPKIKYETMKRENRVHFFLDVPSWLDYMESLGFFIGCRFHGVAAAVLAGVPAVITPIDSRTRELAQFHHLPQIQPKEIQKRKTVREYLEKADFSGFYSHHRENIENYVSFLSENGLDSNLSGKTELPSGTSLLEKEIEKKKARAGNYQAFSTCTLPEKMSRLSEYAYIEAKNKAKKLIRRQQINL